MIKMIHLMNNQILISQIEEVQSELGEPDCKLVKPVLLNEDTQDLESWMDHLTNQDTFMISSDKILTLVEPKPTLLEKYQDLIK